MNHRQLALQNQGVLPGLPCEADLTRWTVVMLPSSLT
jgi:hypothetical protein